MVGGAESAAAHEQNKRTKRTFKLMGWNRNHKVEDLCRVEDTAHTPNFVPDLTQIWASRGCCSCCFWKYLYDVPAAVWLCAWAAVRSGSTRGGKQCWRGEKRRGRQRKKSKGEVVADMGRILKRMVGDNNLLDRVVLFSFLSFLFGYLCQWQW